MAKESKVTLLIGLALMLLIGIIVTDHFSVAQQQQPAYLVPSANPQLMPQSPAAQGQQGAFPQQPWADPQAQAAAPQQSPMQVAPQEQQLQVPIPQPHTYAPQSSQAQPVPRPYELETHQRVPAVPLPNQRQVQPQQPRTPQYRSPFADRLQLTADRGENNVRDTPHLAELAQVERMQGAASTMVHYVQDNESLWKIAQKYYGDGHHWKRIAEANPTRVMSNGNVRPGVRLLIPTEPSAAASQQVAQGQNPQGSLLASSGRPKLITVQPGDTLSELAAEHLGSAGKWKLLLEANKDKLRDPGSLRVGMQLKVPAEAERPQPAPREERRSSPRIDLPPAPLPLDVNPQHASRNRQYKVRSGDTLSAIAQRELGKEHAWHDIFKANEHALEGDPNNLQVGMTLTLPR